MSPSYLYRCVTTFFPCLILLLLHCPNPEALLTYPMYNLWESLAPGELLKLLDRAVAISANQHNVAQRRDDDAVYTESNSNTHNNVTTTTEQPPSHKQHRRAVNNYSTEDHLNPLSANGSDDDEYNYDHAYDEFVRQYFTDKLAENAASEADAGSAESVERLSLEQASSTSVELEPHTQASQKKAKRAHQKQPQSTKSNCRRIRRSKHQMCLICENAKTGEKSESCAWARESEPQRYAFEHERERKRNYKKQSDSDATPASSESEIEQQSSSDESGSVAESQEHESATRNSRQHGVISSCTRRKMGDQMCYRCHDSNGWNTQCHVARGATTTATTAKEKKNEDKNAGDNSHKRQQTTQQRIYKRTISYSYEKGTNGTVTTPTTQQPHASNSASARSAENDDAAAAKSQEKFYIKVIKQNATLDE